MRADALKGHLEGLLLAALEDGPLHGYAVIQALRDRSAGAVDLPSGTVYPALRRLERLGLVDGCWSEAGGRRRRSYTLTSAGRRALGDERSAWDAFARTMTGLLHPRDGDPVTDAVERWLRALDGRLNATGARGREVLAEVEDGLRCAVAVHRGRGLAPDAADAAAAEEFGDPAVVARALDRELAAAALRDIALRLGASGPVLGAVARGARFGCGAAWRRLDALELARVVLGAAPLLPAAIAATVTTVLLVLLAVGPSPRVPLSLAPAAIAAGGAVLAGDAILLAALAHPAPSALLVTAGALSAGRVVLAVHAAYRCAALRPQLS